MTGNTHSVFEISFPPEISSAWGILKIISEDRAKHQKSEHKHSSCSTGKDAQVQEFVSGVMTLEKKT